MALDAASRRVRLETAVHTAVTAVLALGRSIMTDSSRSPANGYLVASSTVHYLVDAALQPLARQANDMCKINQLPVELFHCIASLLPLGDLDRATRVCQSWRQMLLYTPGLWTRISLNMPVCSNSKLTGAFITSLFSRSGELPLTIEFECLEVPESALDGYNDIARIIVAQMHRVRSLSLSLDQLANTDFELILITPAPILRCIRLHPHGGDVLRLPADLFLNKACLDTASFFRVHLPDSACPALMSVVRLYYDAYTINDSAIDQVSTFFPAMRSLTIVGYEYWHDDDTHVQCLLPVELRLPNLVGVGGTIASFPKAAVCLTSVLLPESWYTHELKDLLKPIKCLTDINITRRPWRWNAWDAGYHTAPPRKSNGLCIRLNGVDVAVDLTRGEVIDAMESCSHFERDLCTVAVPHDLWILFSRRNLPLLDKLILYLPSFLARRATFALPSAPHLHKVSLLRLEAQRGFKRRLLDGDIMDILDVFDLSVMVTIVLCGIDLCPRQLQDTLRPVAPHVAICVQPLEEDHTDPWFWTLSKEDAIRI